MMAEMERSQGRSWMVLSRPIRPMVMLMGLMVGQSLMAQTQDAQKAPFTIGVDVNRVLIPVVVVDAQGRTLNDLKKEDFQVLDNGKPRTVSGFLAELHGRSEAAAVSHAPSVNLNNPQPKTEVLPARITVFLFDDMHLSIEDLVHVRAAGGKVLAAAVTGTDMAAVVSISGRVNTGLTRDVAKLQEALTKLHPQNIYRMDGTECPSIDYYQADLIENKHDPVAIQDGNRKFANCNPAVSRPADVGGGANLPTAMNLVESAASRALTLGHQDVMATYAAMAEFVRRIAPLPGQRTLILVSPGFLNIERDSLNAESRIIDMAVQSNITVSALDARGLYTTELSASERSPALSGQSLVVNAEIHRNSMTLAENAMAELANGTGGIFFHNSNDLETGFRTLTETPSCVYLLELPLEGIKADGSYHRLKIKVDRKDIEVRARRGYYVPKPVKGGK
jgi:VWFA-related protein